MDAFVKDMSDLYQNYEKIYNDSPDVDLSVDETSTSFSAKENSVYDSAKALKEEEEESKEVVFSSSSLSSLQTNNNDDTSSKEKDQFSIDSFTSRSNSKIETENENEKNYLNDSSNQFSEDTKLDIK